MAYFEVTEFRILKIQGRFATHTLFFDTVLYKNNH